MSSFLPFLWRWKWYAFQNTKKATGISRKYWLFDEINECHFQLANFSIDLTFTRFFVTHKTFHSYVSAFLLSGFVSRMEESICNIHLALVYYELSLGVSDQFFHFLWAVKCYLGRNHLLTWNAFWITTSTTYFRMSFVKGQ